LDPGEIRIDSQVTGTTSKSEGSFSAIGREESTGARDPRRARRVVRITERDL
jgi:hypothetical protein